MPFLKSYNKALLAFWVIFMLFPCLVWGTSMQLFTPDNQLSSTLINQVLYDSNGFVWVATEDGLNRYDGSKITNYKTIKGDSTSLVNNFVNSLFEDRYGNLIVCTHGGVQLYNPMTDSFYPAAKTTEGQPFFDSSSQILELEDGQLWLIGSSMMNVEIDKNTKNLTLSRLNLPEEIDQVRSGIVDADGNVWLSKERKGTYRYKLDGTLEKFFGKDEDQIITVFAIGPGNALYAGSVNKGLYRYDRVKGTFESMSFDPGDSNNIICDLLSDTDEKLLIATDNGGLKSFDPRTGVTSYVPLPIKGDNKLKIHSIERDGYGNLWCGLFEKGLMMVPATDNGFHALKQQTTHNDIIGTSCVTSLWMDGDNILWVGTDNDGLYAVNPKFSSSRHFDTEIPNVIMSIYEGSDKNRLWIGSYEQGMGYLDKKTGKFTPVKLYSDDGVEMKNVYAFLENPQGEIWIATMGDGVFKYDPNTLQAKPATEINNAINNWVTSMEVTKDGSSMLLGTYDGLCRVDHSHNIVNLMPSSIILDILRDNTRNCLWVATTDGLAQLSQEGEILNLYNTESGLPSNSIYGIEDDGTNIWISTNAGLSRLDPGTEKFTNYTVDDGLHGNEFFKHASFRDWKGNMYFGGVNGITYFDPTKVSSSGREYDVWITDFYLSDRTVKGGMKSGNRVITDQPVPLTKKFNLAHEDNSFSIEFNARNFTMTANAKFLYSFDHDNWETLPHKLPFSIGNGNNTLTFTNVASGKHNLRIKVVDNGVESEPLSVDIDIAPLWYESWWAKIIYVIIFLTLAYLAYRYVLHINNRKMLETKRQHEEEIKEAKLQFFTNISHEIRTPLSLVISPVQTLKNIDNDPERRKAYNTILRNANRILRLVNELMDLRKIDNKQLKLKFEEHDLVPFIQDLYDTFAPAAEAKHITLTYTHEGYEHLPAWIDKQNFDKVLLNVLSNAIKYTPDSGAVNIDLATGENPDFKKPLDKYIEIKVTDTGVGIPEKDRKHIFDRFFRVENSNAGGTGIGLHLTNSLVQMHYGEITVNDNPAGKGSQFIVRIPLGDSHLTYQEKLVNKDKEKSHLEVPKEYIPVLSESTEGLEGRPKSKKNVYIVEDDADVQSYLSENLGKEFRVSAFNNAEEALQTIHNNAPDLIITDVMMPGMDGITFARKLRQNINLNHIPIIMLTAKTRDEDTLEGLDAGVDAYITKPFNIEILQKKVANLIANSQRLRNVYSGNQSQEDKVEDIKATSFDEKLMDRIMKAINKHLSNSDATVEMIAEEVGISRVHLHRKLKELTNQTTRDFLRNTRLQQGAKLLREKKLSVSEVSYLVGFKQPSHFSSNFKEMFGMSPSEYNEKMYNPSSANDKTETS